MGQGFWGAFPRRHRLFLPLWCPRGACFFGRLSPLPLAFFLPPIPPTPFPAGKGETKVVFLQGASPLASPALDRLRHLFALPYLPPAGRGAVSCRACFACRTNAFQPPIPPTPFPAGRGRPKLFFARGFAPCIPGLEPGRHLQNQPSGCPEWGFAPCETGVAFRYPAGAWQLRRGTGKQCRQPRRGGTGGDGTIRR